MTEIFNFALKMKGAGREGGTCEVLRPCHPEKIRNVHLIEGPNRNSRPLHIDYLSVSKQIDTNK